MSVCANHHRFLHEPKRGAQEQNRDNLVQPFLCLFIAPALSLTQPSLPETPISDATEPLSKLLCQGERGQASHATKLTSGARSWWGKTCVLHGTCYRTHPDRHAGFRRPGHAGYATRRAQFPRTRPRSAGEIHINGREGGKRLSNLEQTITARGGCACVITANFGNGCSCCAAASVFRILSVGSDVRTDLVLWLNRPV